MAIEIEAKMRLTDVPALEAKLTEAGAERGPVLLEVNTFYDTPDHRLKTADQGLRIRVERNVETDNEQTRITYKGPRAHGKVKSRTEIEFGILDASAASQLFAALGYEPVLSFEKKRRRWHLGGCAVEIDSLPLLGEFVEIEGPTDEKVLAVRRQLDMGDVPLLRPSYIAMLVTHLAEHGINEKYIGFDGA